MPKKHKPKHFYHLLKDYRFFLNELVHYLPAQDILTLMQVSKAFYQEIRKIINESPRYDVRLTPTTIMLRRTIYLKEILKTASIDGFSYEVVGADNRLIAGRLNWNLFESSPHLTKDLTNLALSKKCSRLIQEQTAALGHTPRDMRDFIHRELLNNTKGEYLKFIDHLINEVAGARQKLKFKMTHTLTLPVPVVIALVPISIIIGYGLGIAHFAKQDADYVKTRPYLGSSFDPGNAMIFALTAGVGILILLIASVSLAIITRSKKIKLGSENDIHLSNYATLFGELKELYENLQIEKENVLKIAEKLALEKIKVIAAQDLFNEILVHLEKLRHKLTESQNVFNFFKKPLGQHDCVINMKSLREEETTDSQQFFETKPATKANRAPINPGKEEVSDECVIHVTELPQRKSPR